MDPELRGISVPFRLVGGRVAVASGDAKLREDLVAVLLTAVGERPMRRSCGGGLEQLVHEPDDDVTRALLRRQVAVAVAQWLPEVVLHEVDVADRDGVLHVDLRYSQRGSPFPGAVSVPVDTTLR
jgi:phage baseplate assembly protein W